MTLPPVRGEIRFEDVVFHYGKGSGVIDRLSLTMGYAILNAAGLSFIGLGVQSPDTSLGLMISLNKNELTLHPWLFLTPFVFIVLISLAVNFIGDGLRDAFDPRQKRVKA